ncbi:MAG: FmdE family protein [Deltaproteobacteria bacterium]|jgi:formylmethanofuran dehydrogenase subunit E
MTYEEIVRFHGHSCPGLAIGYRMSLEAMEALSALRADDEELVAIVENDACGVDALQCITGCTFGKGNLRFLDYGKQVYTIYSRTSRKGVRVHFHGNGIPEKIREDRETLAEWIRSAPFKSLLSIQPVSIEEPEPARIMKSIPCAFCGESVMLSRVKKIEDQPACIPCYNQKKPESSSFE